ncbi:hypothetical protein PMIT1323_00003 [Prochlorococcus marinus str. MIT 1323]|nr:hypothetical protein PMIT1323_00003 [Prochlorococcus marinus str. MIT 1323]
MGGSGRRFVCKWVSQARCIPRNHASWVPIHLAIAIIDQQSQQLQRQLQAQVTEAVIG